MQSPGKRHTPVAEQYLSNICPVAADYFPAPPRAQIVQQQGPAEATATESPCHVEPSTSFRNGYMIIQPATSTQLPISVWAPTLEKATELYGLYNPVSSYREYRRLHATVFDCSTGKPIPELTTSMEKKYHAQCADYFQCEMGKMETLAYPKSKFDDVEHRLGVLEGSLDDVQLLKDIIRKLQKKVSDQERRLSECYQERRLLECEDERKRDQVAYNKRLRDVENMLEDHDAKIGKCEEKSLNCTIRLESHFERMEKHGEKLDNHDKLLGDAKNGIQKNKSDLRDIGIKTKSLERNVAEYRKLEPATKQDPSSPMHRSTLPEKPGTVSARCLPPTEAKETIGGSSGGTAASEKIQRADWPSTSGAAAKEQQQREDKAIGTVSNEKTQTELKSCALTKDLPQTEDTSGHRYGASTKDQSQQVSEAASGSTSDRQLPPSDFRRLLPDEHSVPDSTRTSRSACKEQVSQQEASSKQKCTSQNYTRRSAGESNCSTGVASGGEHGGTAVMTPTGSKSEQAPSILAACSCEGQDDKIATQTVEEHVCFPLKGNHDFGGSGSTAPQPTSAGSSSRGGRSSTPEPACAPLHAATPQRTNLDIELTSPKDAMKPLTRE